MASIEKLVKSLEALKVIQAPVDKPEEAVASTKFIGKSKEVSLTKKDKIAHFSTVAEIICSPQLRSIEDFHKFLGIAIETYLHFCDDQEADVRLKANECLNHVIKNLQDSQIGRIQVELYKEIKKNGQSRSLRAGLARFADLCHNIKPSKRRPYLINLLPCLVKLAQRTDEDAVQETLAIAMAHITPCFGKFASDHDVVTLLKAFLTNLSHAMATVRRTAAICMTLIVEHSKKPNYFLSWLLSALIQSVSTARESNASGLSLAIGSSDEYKRILIGVFLAFKHVMPMCERVPTAEDTVIVATGLSVKQRELQAKESAAISESLIHLYELILSALRNESDHSVTLAGLEALQAIVRQPPPVVLPVLLDQNGISKSKLGEVFAQRPNSVLASPLIAHRRGLQKSRTSSSSMSLSMDNVSSMSALEDDDDIVIKSDIGTLSEVAIKLSLDEKLAKNNSKDTEEGEASDDETAMSICGGPNFSKSTESLDDVSTVPPTPVKTPTVNSRNDMMKLTYLDSEEITMASSPFEGLQSPMARFGDGLDNGSTPFRVGAIGDFTSVGIPPLEYCIRLISSQFLLTGIKTVGLMPDKNVRVSVKALAMSCVAGIVNLHPRALLIDMHLTDDEQSSNQSVDVQKIWDVIYFSTHHDPQLRGQVAMVVSSFLNKVLTISTGFNDFLIANCSSMSFGEAPTLEDLVNDHLIKIIFDAEKSSVAIKSGIVGLQGCLIALIKSNENLATIVIKLLRNLMALKSHNYWLLKVELLNVIALIPFKDIYYLEKSIKLDSSDSSEGRWYVTAKALQEMVLDEVLFELIADDDHRVRQAVATTITKIIPQLYIPSDYPDGDPVTALAFEQNSTNLPSFAANYNSNPLPAGGLFPSQPLPASFGFVSPFSSSERDLETYSLRGHIEEQLSTKKYSPLVESNLRLVVNRLAKYLTLNCGEKKSLIGGVLVLDELSDNYLVTRYYKAWGCDLSSAVNGLSFFRLLLTLFTNSTSPAVLDLSAHQRAMSFLGKVVSGCAYHCLRTSIANSNVTSVDDLDFGLISKESYQLVQLMETLISHLLKLLNVMTAVAEDVVPNLTNSTQPLSTSKTPVIAAFASSTLSPVRKKSFKLGSDDKDKNSSRTRHGSGGSSNLDVFYFKMFDSLRSVFSNYKVTIDASASKNKFVTLLDTVLEVINQQLELTTINYIGKNTDEVLDSLKVLIAISPKASVATVRQLLKAIFGTNFNSLITPDASDLDEEDTTASTKTPHRPSTGSIFGGSTIRPNYGLYQTVISNPYTMFSQFYGNKTYGQSSATSILSRSEEVHHWQIILRKKLEKRVTGLLDKNATSPSSGTPSIPSSISAPKANLSSHIRSFEPVVIKALKVYTVTSDIELQVEVLNLLTQLVKLRVNYCLLDSDQVFLGFVQKQFEFLEAGQLDQPSKLISGVFNFLVLLSYERFQTKPIIAVPKIIQMADGLLASGQSAADYVIPALVPIVEDLFLLRSPNKVESAKELETQREVLVAAILKIACHPKSLDLLTMIVNCAKKESDDKHKKTSRQIMDALLPLLTKQLVAIDNIDALEALHGLFEVVSPVVFRPVDVLLKAFMAPAREEVLTSDICFHRWLALGLVAIRVLMVQAKEEVVLARLDDIRPTSISTGLHGLPVLDINAGFRSLINSTVTTESTASDEMLAEYLLQVLELSIRHLTCLKNTKGNSEFGGQLLGHYLLYLTHMFQSGSFRRLSKSATALIKNSSATSTFEIATVNSLVIELELSQPTLVLQYANLLMLLGFDDNSTSEFWYKLIRRIDSNASPVRSISSATSSNNGSKSQSTSSANMVNSPHVELVRRGTLVLLCDFVCENIADAEQMTWLIVNNIRELIRFSYELPVKDFISAVHRNSASSGLFINAIAVRCEGLNSSSFLKRLIEAVEYIHPTQSGSLVSLLIEQIISNPLTSSFVTLRMSAENLAFERLQMILKSDNLDEKMSQMSVEDVNKLIGKISPEKNRRLFDALEQFKSVISAQPENGSEQTLEHPLNPVSVGGDQGQKSKLMTKEVGRDWFVAITREMCGHRSHETDLAPALNKLPHEDLTRLLADLRFLPTCLKAGANFTSKSTPFSSNFLFKSATNAISGHIQRLVTSLPIPHCPFLVHETVHSPKESKHRRKLVVLFEDTSFRELLIGVGPAFVEFLINAPITKLGSELSESTLRLSILYAEFGLFNVEMSNVEHISLIIKVLNAFANCDQLLSQLTIEKHVSFAHSLITAIQSITEFIYGPLRTVFSSLAFKDFDASNPETRHAHQSCVQASQLIQFLEDLDTVCPTTYHSRHRFEAPLNSLRKLILTISRLPLVNSYVMVPPTIWKQNIWTPNLIGNFNTICPTVPSEELRDVELLSSLIYRIQLIGWTSRIQFEEIWMSLLGVVSIVQAEAAESQTPSNEDTNERVQIISVAMEGMTDLLIQSLLVLKAGDPVRSHYVQLKQVKSAAFAHTKYGERLAGVKATFEHPEHLESFKKVTSVGHDHISVEFLRKSIGVQLSVNQQSTLNSPSVSSGSDSNTSSSTPSPATPKSSDHLPSINDLLPYRSSLDIDLRSCVMFILDLIGQIIGSELAHPPLLVSLERSVLRLSDLFFESSQFDWLLETFLNLYKMSVITEDEVQIQHLVFGILKASAVLGIDAEATLDKVRKCVENGLRSSFLGTRISTLHGLMFLLESREVLIAEKEQLFLPLISDYVLKHVSDISLPSSRNEDHVKAMWMLTFHLIEHFVDEFSENEFGQKVFQIAIKAIGSEDTPPTIREIISSGLERLLVCEVFAIKDADLIVRVTIEKMKVGSFDEIASFRLILTAIYVFGLAIGNDATGDEETGSTEELLAAMEKVGVLFDRLKACGPNEAEKICAALPLFLIEFFPSQDVLNKIIGEFLSAQQLYPKSLVGVVAKVFASLVSASKLDVVHDWVLLSLSSFTQLEPLSLATWSLTVFLISASANEWIRCIYPCVRERLGKFEEIDKQVLSVVCSTFYSELKTDENKEAFLSTLLSVAREGTPYSYVISHLRR